MICLRIALLAGLDFSAIQVPHSGSSGSLSGGNGGNGGGGVGSGLTGIGGSGILQNPISIGMNDDPAMVREAFFKNPDQLALVSDCKVFISQISHFSFFYEKCTQFKYFSFS